MSASPTRIELLSPAKTAEIGIAAINHGADAVYIGGPSFGARHNAGNDLRDIERLVRHAHRFNARIFLTLNTILRDDELPKAQALIQSAYDCGVDALIIQDMGLLMLDLPLFSCMPAHNAIFDPGKSPLPARRWLLPGRRGPRTVIAGSQGHGQCP